MAAAEAAAVAEQLDALRKAFREDELRSCTPSFVQLYFRRTDFSEITIKINIAEKYPDEPAVVQLSSKSLHDDLVAKLQTGVQAEANKKATLLRLAEMIRQFIHVNKVAPAFDDLRTLKREIPSLKVIESKGTVSARLGPPDSKYYLSIKATLHEDYPRTLPLLQVVGGTFPDDITASVIAQALETARISQRGGKRLNPLNRISTDSKLEDIANQHRQRIIETNRAEVEAAQRKEREKKAKEAELKRLAKIGERKPWHKPVNAKREPKAALSSNAPKDLPPDEDEEKRRRRSNKNQDHCEKLPTTACAVCMFALFGDAKIEGQALGKQGKGLERLACGCMYHNSCLRTYISEPPFGKKKFCLVCGQVLYHHTINCDEKTLEQQWANKMAREREIKEVAEFLDFADLS